jgi:hypothetical protein
MMEYPCPLYMQKLSLFTEALSAALFSIFRTLKEHAHVVSIIDSLRGFLVSFVPLKNARACARTRVVVRGTRPLLFTEDYVPQVWPLHCGSGFSLLRFFSRCYAPFWPR